MVDISKARKSIEKMCFDTCDIYEYFSYKDPVTKRTKHNWDIVHENIPCKLSFKTITSTTIDDGVGKIGQAAKLSINPDIVIKAGSKIVVWVISLLNKIPGINIGKVGGSGLDKIDSYVGSMKDFQKTMKAPVRPDKIIAERPDFINPNDNFKKGYDIGAKWEQGIKDKFDINKMGEEARDKLGLGDLFDDKYGLNNLNNGLGGANNPLTGGNKADKETAANTAKMAKTMEATQEDLKYLRDIAEQNTINNSTIEVKVDITNHNTINNDLDLDGVVDKLNTEIQEKVAMEAEGLYI
jgi:hypothetical protein